MIFWWSRDNNILKIFFQENIPKENKEIEKEDEELKKEALIKEQEMKAGVISKEVKTREKQISNDSFVTL